jgi:hypothetical protein
VENAHYASLLLRHSLRECLAGYQNQQRAPEHNLEKPTPTVRQFEIEAPTSARVNKAVVQTPTQLAHALRRTVA